MQTFLPYSEFEFSARCLDRQRLGKQRVEAKQILNVLRNLRTPPASYGPIAWYNHPAVRQWEGHEALLCVYGQVICDEWTRRGYRDSLRAFFDEQLSEIISLHLPDNGPPWWLGNERFHQSHQARLYVKDPRYYTLFSDVVAKPCCPGCNYFWPTHVR